MKELKLIIEQVEQTIMIPEDVTMDELVSLITDHIGSRPDDR